MTETPEGYGESWGLGEGSQAILRRTQRPRPSAIGHWPSMATGHRVVYSQGKEWLRD